MRQSSAIGVFDSGFGGLHTLRALVGALPSYDYLYLGDSARAPYGPRPAGEIREFSEQALDYLFAHGCELAIFACNTASSDALRFLQRTYMPEKHPDKKVLGVLIPLSEAAVSMTRSQRIGVIATAGTVASGAFVRELTKLDPSLHIFQEPAPRLVPLIEAGGHASAELSEAIAGYLRPLLAASIDTLILGCTHYGFAIREFRRLAGPDVAVISEGEAVPDSLRSYLARHEECAKRLSHGGTATFCTTGETERFDALGSAFFGSPVSSARISLSA